MAKPKKTTLDLIYERPTCKKLRWNDLVIFMEISRAMADFDFEYKGYLGKVVIDPDSDSISGYVINLEKSGMSFRGESVTQAKADFIATVDDYLAYCAEEGLEVEQPKSMSLT